MKMRKFTLNLNYQKLAIMLMLVFTASASFGQAVPELLYYKFDTTGTVVRNQASSPPSGTAFGSINSGLSIGAGGACSSNALIGTGGSDYFNTNWATSTSGSWTISFWGKDQYINSGSAFYLFGDPNASSFRCFTSGIAFPGNYMLRGGFNEVLLSGGANGDSVCTFVYDATAGNIKAYRNKTLVNTVNQGTITLSSSGTFKLGNYNSSTGMISGSKLDEFRFYNRALSASEVAALVGGCCTAMSSITVTPSSGTYTGGVNTNLYIGYPSNTPSATITSNGGSIPTWTPSTNLSCSTCFSPVFTPTSAGNYTFTAINCADTQTVTICVKDIRVPNTSGTKAAVYMCHLEPGKTTPQTLAVVLRGIPGHFQYHKGDKLGVCGNTCTSNKRDFEVADLVIDEQYLEVMCTPNPFRNSFKLNYVSHLDIEATISIYGMTGNLMETTTLNGVSNEAELGNNLPNGIYTVSFNQGDTKKVFRMIKID